ERERLPVDVLVVETHARDQARDELPYGHVQGNPRGLHGPLSRDVAHAEPQGCYCSFCHRSLLLSVGFHVREVAPGAGLVAREGGRLATCETAGHGERRAPVMQIGGSRIRSEDGFEPRSVERPRDGAGATERSVHTEQERAERSMARRGRSASAGRLDVGDGRLEYDPELGIDPARRLDEPTRNV